jgi:hypothetical protein
MLNALVVIVVVLAAALFVMFAALCLAIRKEDRGPRLASRPSSAVVASARRIAGLSVRRSSGPARPQPDPRLALSGSARSEHRERR